MSFGRFIYTWASMNFFRHFTVRKQVSLFLLRGSLAYIFSQLLKRKQYVKGVFVQMNCVLHAETSGIHSIERFQVTLSLSKV